jgi:CheY-like chemotaxis protein
MSNPITVLIVDGDAHNLMTLSAQLKALDIHYKRNTTGSNVLEQARGMQTELDAILVDTNLPEADAFSLCQAIKQDPLLAKTPVIAMSPQFNEDMLQKARQHGFAGMMVRPLSRTQLGGYLRRIISGERVVCNGTH